MRPLHAGSFGRSAACGRRTDTVPDRIGVHSRAALDEIAGFRGSGERRTYDHHPRTRRRNETRHDHFSPSIIGSPAVGFGLIGNFGRPAPGVHWMRIAPI